ncbi:MAG: hypothetical protein ORN28_11115 [Rhodoferax sp.]|nr:hypothetical protein [Rhodoferax sp.]
MKKNMLAGFLCLLYTSLLGLGVGPVYLRQMGTEAYGLIGFFAVMQSGFSLLDLGFSMAMQRETARYWSSVLDAPAWHRTYRALSWTVAGCLLLVTLLIALFAHSIAEHWLQSQQMALEEVVQAVQIMAACAALRFASNFQKNVLAGSERMVTLAIFRCVIASFSFVGVFAAMDLWGATVKVFFLYQLVLAIIECAGWIILSRRTMPAIPPTATTQRPQRLQDRLPLLPSLSVSLALTSTLSLLITQFPKFFLSGLLDLHTFAYVALAVLVSNGISLMEQTLCSVFRPRLVYLHAQGNEQQQRAIYFQSTQWMTAFVLIPSLVMALFALPLVLAWTGDAQVAAQVAPVLRLYALGNGLLALARLSYALQYAEANLRLHVIGDLLFMLLVLPATYWATGAQGGVGAGAVWLACSGLYLLLWSAWTHRLLMPRQHLRWLWHGIVRLLLLPCLALGGIWLWMEMVQQPQSRTAAAMWLLLASALSMGLAVLLLDGAWQSGLRFWHRYTPGVAK